MRRAIPVAATVLLAAPPPPAAATPVDQIVGGTYQYGAATPNAADCSGLVSVVQTLAMGQPPHRLGNTDTLLAGRWPHALPGATPDNRFIIGVNPSHMVAKVNGVRIEATCCGQPFKIGPAATSPFAPQFTQWHIDEAVLM